MKDHFELEPVEDFRQCSEYPKIIDEWDQFNDAEITDEDLCPGYRVLISGKFIGFIMVRPLPQNCIDAGYSAESLWVGTYLIDQYRGNGLGLKIKIHVAKLRGVSTLYGKTYLGNKSAIAGLLKSNDVTIWRDDTDTGVIFRLDIKPVN